MPTIVFKVQMSDKLVETFETVHDVRGAEGVKTLLVEHLEEFIEDTKSDGDADDDDDGEV